MKHFLRTIAIILSLTLARPASAALAVGDQAPDFSVEAVQSDTSTPMQLSELLRAGPVVIFFMPYIHSGASAAECRAFADAIEAFHAAGATVLGMSRDPVDELAQFSLAQCAGKVPMASVDLSIVTSFDVNDNANFATRTTYVIAPSGEIAFVHNEDDHNGHASRALAFVQAMERESQMGAPYRTTTRTSLKFCTSV
jgi:thioredoxin-dependent peroxiredoxin